MRKFLLIPLAALLAPATHGQTTIPAPYFSENFAEAAAAGTALPTGWTAYGLDAVPADEWQSLFGEKGGEPYYITMTLDGKSAAWSCSTFHAATTADEWLVSPPIHIDSDHAVLSFKALATGSYNINNYRVYLTDKGGSKADFTDAPKLNSTIRGWGDEANSRTSCVAVNGYAGKDLRIAFVNRSRDCGLLGFSDITISPYWVEASNLTPTVMPAGSEVDVTVSLNVRTPVEVPGFTVKFSASDGTAETRKMDVACDMTGSRVTVLFPGIKVPADGLEYSLEVTPLYDDAPSTTVKGEVGIPMTSYPSVAVIEEFTGTWCSNCPRGTAFMNYYHDTYTGLDGKGKAIGIALHSKNDPMMMTNPSYHNTAFEISGAKGYPSAFFNRRVLGDPSDKDKVDAILSERSNSKIKLNKVSWSEGTPISVSYEVTNSYTMSNVNQRVAFVVVENNVVGSDESYTQVNGFAGVPRQAVETTYGADLWEYFQPFCEGDTYMPYADLSYQHVARGIWPDYYGEQREAACIADVPVAGTARFEMPAQVDKPANTAVIALLLDGKNGQIIGADEVEAAHYNQDLSGIADIASEGCIAIRSACGSIVVETPADARIEIMTLDGRVAYIAELNAGTSIVDCGALSGVHVVRVALSDASGPEAVAVAKVVL